MSTNFYLIKKTEYDLRVLNLNKSYGILREKMADMFYEYIKNYCHIGKKSIGWQFHFEKSSKIKSYSDLKCKMEIGEYYIVNSDFKRIKKNSFYSMVENSYLDTTNKGYKDVKGRNGSHYLDKEGYWFTDCHFC